MLREAEGEAAGPGVEIDDFACAEEFVDPSVTVLCLVLHSVREPYQRMALQSKW